MTLGELFSYIDQHTPYRFNAGTDTIDKAKNNGFSNELIGQLILAIAEKCQCHNLACTVTREKSINAISQIRLQYMADSAPVEGFRLVEKVVTTIDAAFNAEAIRNR